MVNDNCTGARGRKRFRNLKEEKIDGGKEGVG